MTKCKRILTVHALEAIAALLQIQAERRSVQTKSFHSLGNGQMLDTGHRYGRLEQDGYDQTDQSGSQSTQHNTRFEDGVRKTTTECVDERKRVQTNSFHRLGNGQMLEPSHNYGPLEQDGCDHTDKTGSQSIQRDILQTL